MPREEESSVAEVASTHAPTTIPEEPTPVSPASPGIPVDSESALQAHSEQSNAHATQQQPVKLQEGRFIEMISSDGSRASADNNADEQPKHVNPMANRVREMQMRALRASKQSSNVLRRNSNRNNAHPSKLDATASSSGYPQQISPTTDSSSQHASPLSNDQSSPSSEGARHFRAFKKLQGEDSGAHDGANVKTYAAADDQDDDHDVDEHPILSALYPLTNFIGYRPVSHPHTPPDRRLTPKHPEFNRFHYICGSILSLGLAVSGETGQIARYRDPDTGEMQLVRMYKEQVGAKVVNSIHSLIAAWVVVALICLVSRSPFHRSHNAPLIIGAFATEAVVTFFAYRTPLAQPKNILFGNTIASVVGVGMQKAFKHTNYDFDGVYGVDWAAAATAVGVAIFAMQILGFTHPPGAAISLLSLTSAKTSELGWWLIPIVVIASLIVIGWALFINNVGGRRYPDNWFYSNAFAEPPIVGPEKLAFTNAPFHPLPGRHKPKRKRAMRDEQLGRDCEKRFYRVPDSGVKLSYGFGTSSVPQPNDTPATQAGTASHNLGGAARVHNTTYPSSHVASGSRQSCGATGANRVSGEDGRTTRACEATKVESSDSHLVQAGASTQAWQSISASQPTNNQKAAADSGVKSRMIETDVTIISRNNSKGSKRSRKSIVVHVNENGRHSTGSSNKLAPVPGVQWRKP